MKARHQCSREGRTPRFNLPVCRHSPFRRLLNSFMAPPTRLHRYRDMTRKILEHELDKLDGGRCA